MPLFFIPILYRSWSHFFFIHTVKYIQTVLCLYISTRFYFFLYLLLPVTQMKSCDPSSEKVAYIFDTNCYFLLLFRKPKYCYLFSGTSLKTRANSFGRVNYGTTGSFFRHCYALVVIFLLLRENMILSINDHFSFQFIESTSLIVKKNSPIMCIQVDQGQIFQ